MARQIIKINRAPVLTLWATVIAERLGFRRAEALTLGRAVAGLNAYSKGVALGLFHPSPRKLKEQRKNRKGGRRIRIALLGRAVPVTRTPAGLHALSGGRQITPQSVKAYLHNKFGDHLPAVRIAMNRLAKAISPAEANARGYRLYVKFRPSIPGGTKGWGAKGRLDLSLINRLSKTIE